MNEGTGYVTVDNIRVPIEGEKNLLTLIRKANVDIPTFCYHSSLSTYGACRLCLVEIDGKKIDASCVVPPKDGMTVKTTTPRIRGMRRMNLELLLANHKQDCPTCERSADCRLRDLASKMGVKNVRFRRTREERPMDLGSVALMRDPNKCVLCGDCVRYCSEIQGIGAIDFAHRGEDVTVTPAFGRSLGEVDCVNCGQCAAVCPTGAIVPKTQVDAVWKEIADTDRIVVAQIAPAVRVALGEMFGIPSGQAVTGKITTALRMLGFDRVYDTAFGADLTVIEEAQELIARRSGKGTDSRNPAAARTGGSTDAKAPNLPLFTSCCPAWVKFAEQSFPDLLGNLSSCMSPQGMVGSLAKRVTLPAETGATPDKVCVVAIMPCTAKKFEATRPELSADGEPLVDHVLTTTELGKMIQEAGIRFENLAASPMDLPMGFTTGAGVIFGNSGGVSEAVARYLASASEAAGGRALPTATEPPRFEEVPGEPGVRAAVVSFGDSETISVAVVQGLANAKRLARRVQEGSVEYDLVEVMACPGGCIGGAGQPVGFASEIRRRRTEGLINTDGELPLRRSQENPFITQYYLEHLGGAPGSHRAHEILHTVYQARKRIQEAQIPLVTGTAEKKLPVRVCVGTSCFLRGSQEMLSQLILALAAEGLDDVVDVNATFCAEQCSAGPTFHVGDEVVTGASVEELLARVRELAGALTLG
ncbi:MAG: [FeFe] hydrogenase, group A [Spirochaetaceae bacterium]